MKMRLANVRNIRTTSWVLFDLENCLNMWPMITDYRVEPDKIIQTKYSHM